MTIRLTSHRGFTLVELLVVVAIIGTLLGLFSVGSRPSRRTQIRIASQNLASLLLTTQTSALNSDIGAAIWLSDSGIFSADIPTQDDLVKSVNDILDPVSGVLINPSDLINRNTVRIQLPSGVIPPPHVYRARFFSSPAASVVIPPSPWFSVSQTVGNSADITFHNSQQTTNTIWPASFYLDPSDPKCSIEFQQHPVRSSLAEEWPNLGVIDLRYSGFGETVGLTADVSILFSQTGQPVVLFTGLSDSPAAEAMRGTLYFLVAFSEDVSAGKNTLANDDSVWIRMEGETGHVTLAWNNPVLDNTYPPSAANLQTARQNLREGRGLSR